MSVVKSSNKGFDLVEALISSLKSSYLVFEEIYNGILSGAIPWAKCFFFGIIIELFFLFDLHIKLIKNFRLEWLLKYLLPYRYFILVPILLVPFFLWACFRVFQKRRLALILRDTFLSIGLKNSLGKIPFFISDVPIDERTRKLCLTKAMLSLETFLSRKDAIESALRIYIDEIRENREAGTITIIYAHEPMPQIFEIKTVKQEHNHDFVIGINRSNKVFTDLNESPHLLVAGQTGGGKSTFLRQLITTLYLNHSRSEFILIDLKGGLEFQLFEKLPRVHVLAGVKEASLRLIQIENEIKSRMEILKKSGSKDIAEYLKKIDDKNELNSEVNKNLRRKFIVIDEAAEMFLAGAHASAKEVHSARRVLSQVARLGRSVGIHLIVATQRPDVKALDPQIKLNLPGVLCFQMVNDVSSINVLGSGRATELPSIPGRAIWKRGMTMIEVQTPFLSPESAEKILEPYRKEFESNKDKEKTTCEQLSNLDSDHDDRYQKVERNDL